MSCTLNWKGSFNIDTDFYYIYLYYMKPKLLELARILKQNPEIKERLERLIFGCWVETKYWNKMIIDREEDFIYNNWWPDYNYLIRLDESCDVSYFKIIGHEPSYHDVLEYLGRDYKMDFTGIYLEGIVFDQLHISPWPLSDQSDETLDEIISLCKNVWK